MSHKILFVLINNKTFLDQSSQEEHQSQRDWVKEFANHLSNWDKYTDNKEYSTIIKQTIWSQNVKAQTVILLKIIDGNYKKQKQRQTTKQT